MGEGLSCVFITANFIKNRAAVQEETELLNQKSAQALNASVQGGFVYSGNVFPTIAAVSDLLMLVLYMLTVISLQMMIGLAN